LKFRHSLSYRPMDAARLSWSHNLLATPPASLTQPPLAQQTRFAKWRAERRMPPLGKMVKASLEQALLDLRVLEDPRSILKMKVPDMRAALQAFNDKDMDEIMDRYLQDHEQFDPFVPEETIRSPVIRGLELLSGMTMGQVEELAREYLTATEHGDEHSPEKRQFITNMLEMSYLLKAQTAAVEQETAGGAGGGVGAQQQETDDWEAVPLAEPEPSPSSSSTAAQPQRLPPRGRQPPPQRQR
jgi:hypothetical protein